MPLKRIFTSTWPTSSASGSPISVTTSGLRKAVRMAAFVERGRVIASSLEKDERVIPLIAGLSEPPFPFLRRAERLARDLPIEQVGLFDFVPVGLDTDVFVFFADPLNLAQRLVEVVIVKVVEGIERVHQIEMLVRVGKQGGVTHEKSVLDFFLGILYGVHRDVNAVDFDARYHLGEVVEQNILAAADVQDRVAGLDTIAIGHRAGDLFPTALDIAISAIIDPAVPVPILLTPFLGISGSSGFPA